MKCPVCKDVTLLMSEKNGVEIDYCPECRGIWLDRGELDKIVERARDARDGYREDDRHRVEEQRYDERRYDERKRYDDRRYDDSYYKKHKKKSPMSALGDIMEIFGGD
ncbi:zf-TFIIB domain-containing protein [Enorma phocaeensis]|uniref:TFIIB-type zinc ribbon-containing protein n=1 Tax=Enorma phocaeensis TaxID=1871019 RepID=UPI000C85DDBE|nr:zf-TFIIB domain-containing protein [Enorma phocaeensis]